MSDTFKTALTAALDYHTRHEMQSPEEVLAVAKLFYRELAVAAPNGVDAYDEDWYSQVHTWLRVLNGDQLGCVSTAVQRISAERNPPMQMAAQPPPGYAPIPTAPGAIPPAWELLDQLNGPQPYPGIAAPVGPLVTRDELEARLAKLGGDRQSHRDVQEAAESVAAGESQPFLALGDPIRIRPRGTDPLTTDTYLSQVLHGPEGFYALVEPGAFSEATADRVEAASATKLLKILSSVSRGGVARQGTNLLTLAQDVAEDLKNATGQLQAREVGIREHEKELRQILGARPESDDWDNPHNEETTTDAARRVVKELAAAEERVQHLVWQLAEEQIEHRGRVRYFTVDEEPPATVTVLKLVVKPTETDAFGGYLSRLGEGWIRTQHKPEPFEIKDGSPWAVVLPLADATARELTSPELANWEAGR